MTGCLVHATLLAFGVSALIRQNPKVYFSIKLFGALYMFFLAFKVLISSSELNISNGNTEKKPLMALYKKGFIMNVLNPKVTIFFLAFFPGFLFSHFLNIMIQFYVLAVIFILVSATIFIAIAILAGSISKYIRAHGRSVKILKWLQIIVFVAIAVYLLLSDK